ncbi:hypothetical protein BJ742DRAFT_859718 [Cladochytrium replicatum]|nr:hypothetical protein BJ742DRAFT_859718 [Cladochytrium replicatum]
MLVKVDHRIEKYRTVPVWSMTKVTRDSPNMLEGTAKAFFASPFWSLKTSVSASAENGEEDDNPEVAEGSNGDIGSDRDEAQEEDIQSRNTTTNEKNKAQKSKIGPKRKFGQSVEEPESLSRQITGTAALKKVRVSSSTTSSGSRSPVTSVSSPTGWEGNLLVYSVLSETARKRRKTEAAVGVMAEAMGSIAENIQGGNLLSQTAGPDS